MCLPITDQALGPGAAFSFGDGPPLDIGLDETLESFRRKLKKKAKRARKTKSKVDPPPTSVDEAAPISASEPLLGACYMLSFCFILREFNLST